MLTTFFAADVGKKLNVLADGGRLVSIMSESAFFRQDKKAFAFRAWLAELGGSVVHIPAGAFKESGTGVKTRMIIVDKPEGETFPINEVQASEASSESEMYDTPQPQLTTSSEVVDFIISLVQDGPQQPVNAAPTLVNISPESEPDEAAPDLVTLERGMQKALDGFGANDRLLRLNQHKMF